MSNLAKIFQPRGAVDLHSMSAHSRKESLHTLDIEELESGEPDTAELQDIAEIDLGKILEKFDELESKLDVVSEKFETYKINHQPAENKPVTESPAYRLIKNDDDHTFTFVWVGIALVLLALSDIYRIRSEKKTFIHYLLPTLVIVFSTLTFVQL
jgi:hypothetical protein